MVQQLRRGADIVRAAIVSAAALSLIAGDGPAGSLLGSALATAAAVLWLGALWELVEWIVDAAFGTDFSQGYDDTLDDLRTDAAAAAVSGALVAAWLRWEERM